MSTVVTGLMIDPGFAHFVLGLLILAAIPTAVALIVAACQRRARPKSIPHAGVSRAAGTALSAPKPATPAHRSAETVGAFGEHAVQKALRPIWLAKRPAAFSAAELEAWSECAAAFDEDHQQQGWR